MTRLGKKYQHLVYSTGCDCCSPSLQQASRRLEAFSRRGFLAGLAATAAAGMIPRSAFAQTSGQAAKLLFRQVRLFDGKSDALRAGVQVLIERGRIASVDATNSAPPSDATVINCGDRVLMPGMIDAHWHTLYAAVPLAALLAVIPALCSPHRLPKPNAPFGGDLPPYVIWAVRCSHLRRRSIAASYPAHASSHQEP
jgi:hypothetical protein